MAESVVGPSAENHAISLCHQAVGPDRVTALLLPEHQGNPKAASIRAVVTYLMAEEVNALVAGCAGRDPDPHAAQGAI
jgi:hypothetical protein